MIQIPHHRKRFIAVGTGDNGLFLYVGEEDV